MRKVKVRDESGFTLVELLIVIAIIGVLAAIAIPVFLSQIDKAAVAGAQSDANTVAKLVTAQLASNDIAGTSLTHVDTAAHGVLRPAGAAGGSWFWNMLDQANPTWNAGALGSVSISDSTAKVVVNLPSTSGFCVYAATSAAADIQDANGDGAIDAGNTSNVFTAGPGPCLTIPAP